MGPTPSATYVYAREQIFIFNVRRNAMRPKRTIQTCAPVWELLFIFASFKQCHVQSYETITSQCRLGFVQRKTGKSASALSLFRDISNQPNMTRYFSPLF